MSLLPDALYDTSIEDSILFYFNKVVIQINWGFPGGIGVKNLPANVGDTEDVSSIARSGRSPGVGNGNPLQYSCLENSTDRGAWRTTVHGVRLSTHTQTYPATTTN